VSDPRYWAAPAVPSSSDVNGSNSQAKGRRQLRPFSALMEPARSREYGGKGHNASANPGALCAGYGSPGSKSHGFGHQQDAEGEARKGFRGLDVPLSCKLCCEMACLKKAALLRCHEATFPEREGPVGRIKPRRQ